MKICNFFMPPNKPLRIKEKKKQLPQGCHFSHTTQCYEIKIQRGNAAATQSNLNSR